MGLFHAFGYGTPVVAGDNAAKHFPEARAIRPEENALVFAHGDAEFLAASLVRLLRDQGLQRTLGENAQRTVTTEYTLEEMADGMKAALLGTYPRSTLTDLPT